ncbi:hypothetical protein MRX96_028761 [Rhipicephalus microplus]
MIHPALVASYRGDVSALWWMQQRHRIGALGRGHAEPSLRHVRDSAGAGCAHYAARGGHVSTLRFLVLAAGLRPHEKGHLRQHGSARGGGCRQDPGAALAARAHRVSGRRQGRLRRHRAPRRRKVSSRRFRCICFRHSRYSERESFGFTRFYLSMMLNNDDPA